MIPFVEKNVSDASPEHEWRMYLFSFFLVIAAALFLRDAAWLAGFAGIFAGGALRDLKAVWRQFQGENKANEDRAAVENEGKKAVAERATEQVVAAASTASQKSKLPLLTAFRAANRIREDLGLVHVSLTARLLPTPFSAR